MEGKSKYYVRYRYDDGTTYKVEIGKDGVKESDMRNLRRVIKSQDKVNEKMAKLDTVPLIEIDYSLDKHSILSNVVDTELLIEAIVENDALTKAIEKLQPQQKELVRKIFFQGIPPSEVAEELGITRQSVNDRLSKIYARLKKFL